MYPTTILPSPIKSSILIFSEDQGKKPDAYLSSIVNWAPINDKILHAADHQARGNDIAVAETAKQHLQNESADVLFLHFDEIDGAGHKNEYSAARPSHTKVIARTDSLIALAFNADRDKKIMKTKIGSS